MITLVFAEPPSKNRLYTPNKGGFTKAGKRIKRMRISDAYKAWIDESAVVCLGQRGVRDRILGAYTVRLEASTKSRKDGDGMLVPVLDFLVKMRITPDDKLCRHSEAIKLDTILKGQCRVIVSPWVGK